MGPARDHTGDASAGSTAEQPALDVIRLLGERVAVLHGPKESDALSGRDIDCLVDGLDLSWPIRLSGGWRLCQWTQYDLRGWYWVLEHEGDFVAIDTTDDPDGYSRDALRTRSLFDGMRGDPSPLLHAAYLTVKRARKAIVEPEGWARLGRVASRDPAGFVAELERIAGPDLCSLLAPFALEGRVPPPPVLARATRLRLRRRFGSPARVVRGLSLGVRRYAERVAHPAGLNVLVVGPDGAGKSTIAGFLLDSTSPMFRRHVRSHWRPGILPRPGSFMGKPVADATEPHAREPFGRLPSAILLAYYWLDFWLGAWLRDLPSEIRAGLVIRERGWWDVAVDPRRYRLRVPPGAVSALGRLLPRPHLMIALVGDASLLHTRKPELDPEELDRQREAWRFAVPKGTPVVRIDVSRPLQEVLAEATEAVTALMESRAVARLNPGWAALPPSGVRWWLPRAPRPVAGASVAIYQPVTERALAGWTIAREIARRAGFRLLPRGTAPPRAVRRMLAPHVPARGTFAVARATHPGRFVALILDERGTRRAVAKLAMDAEGARALRAEGAALRRLGPLLPDPLTAPEVLHAEPGVLLLEHLDWMPRREPWVLDEALADALGRLFASGMRDGRDGPEGPAHGDVAPWNVLRTARGWALVDWESAGDAPAFHDVCHHVVQSHALLGRPSASDVVAGFVEGRGWVGRAVGGYATAAGLDPGSAPEALARYLQSAIEGAVVRSRGERRGQERRRDLLARLQR